MYDGEYGYQVEGCGKIAMCQAACNCVELSSLVYVNKLSGYTTTRHILALHPHRLTRSGCPAHNYVQEVVF